ncbi:hypothetical protein ACFOWX_04590 [Sphingorhabdus arenilitoris]|uniref:Uncharacterized protein n=1 Tax=Sphingorhabdus arenilitoris TaxID=1490041 RepID=A0ABV8REN9_9SPHN
MRKETKPEIAEMLREVSISLKLVGCDLVLGAAEHDRLNSRKIHTKCSYASSWIDDGFIRLGNDVHDVPIPRYKRRDKSVEEFEKQTGRDLYQIPIFLQIFEVDSDWFDKCAENHDGEKYPGFLSYHEPYDSEFGNSETGDVYAWIGLGKENYALLVKQILSFEKPDFKLNITVKFPPQSIDSGWTETNVHWDGKGSLPITKANISWTKGSLEDSTDEDVESNRLDFEEAVHSEAQEARRHGEVLEALQNLSNHFAKLTMSLWLIFIALLVFAYFSGP